MDYDRKELVDWVRGIYQNLDDADKQDALRFFPQLSESEKERMMRVIGLALTDVPEERFTSLGTTLKDCLAYLEKQKKQKSEQYSPLCNTVKDKISEYIANHFVTDTVVKTDAKSIVKAMEEGIRLGREECHSAEWSEEDEDMLNSCISSIEEAKENRYAYKETNGDTSYDLEISFLKSLRPQPKQEWSEDDDWKRKELIQYLEEKGDYRTVWMTWLKSLHPQSHWKPSEQEKSALRTAISILTDKWSCPKTAEQLQNILNAFEGKESRKEWKPSEEQMDAFEESLMSVAYTENKTILESLYEQLKKL